MQNIPVVLEVAVIAGGTWGLRHFRRRPRTVPEMMERIDMELALKCCRLTANESFTQDEWISMRRGSGLWHMLRQARLLTAITIEIRKDNRKTFDAKNAELAKAAKSALWRYAIRCIGEKAPYQNGRLCVATFAEIFQFAENAIVALDSV